MVSYCESVAFETLINKNNMQLFEMETNKAMVIKIHKSFLLNVFSFVQPASSVEQK